MAQRSRLAAICAALAVAIGAVAFLLARGPRRPHSQAAGPQRLAQAGEERNPGVDVAPRPARPVASAAGDSSRSSESNGGHERGDRTAKPGKAGGEGSRAAGAAGAHAKPLPKLQDGSVDFAALGLTGKEAGAELLRTAETPREEAIRFDFETGSSFVVETYYRQTQSGDGTVWSGPVYWRFEITGEDRFEKKLCLVFSVAMIKKSGAPIPSYPETRYYVSKTDYTLLGAYLHNTQGGKGRYQTVSYASGGGTSRAAGSIVPFDLPAYGSKGRLTRGPGAELPRLEPNAAKLPKHLPRPGELLGAGGEYLLVEFPSPGDGSTIRQRWWKGDMRWPVESVTEHRRSYRRE